MALLSMALIFFLIMDPIGNVAYFLNVLEEIPPKSQRWVILREMLIALLIMVIFFVLGDDILDILEVSKVTVSLTSGVILFLVAVKILYPKPKTNRISAHAGINPFIVPLAIPLIAGPALLATIMLFSHQFGWVTLYAILIAWFASITVLIFSKFLMNTLGKNGLIACERVMGMILIMLSVQRFLEGIRFFVDSMHA